MKAPASKIHFKTFGNPDAASIIWGHGWGQSGDSFKHLIASLEKSAHHTAIDFQGFGNSPPPSSDWGTEDYADAMAEFIKSQTTEKIIWVGHSFGCRVGLQLAARHPDLIKGLFLISGAGLKRYRPWHRKSLLIKARIYLFKFLKKIIPLGLNEDWLKRKFGSADYKNAGAMRDIMVKVINEDLSDIARTITCPVHMVYGENDTETPPEIGTRLSALIPNSDLTILPQQDHYTVLEQGRHQVAPLLKKFIKSLQQTS